MYRSNLGTKDRSGAIAAVVAIHAALLFAFLNIAGKISLGDAQSVLRVFDVSALKPAPPPPPPQQKTQSKAKAKEGGPAPRNIKSEATPVVAPKPRIQAPPTIAATETPRQGSGPTQGASAVPGAGTGAGGVGTGTGSGSGGNGPGGGGGGVAEPPHLLTGVLNGRDFPAAIQRNWPHGAVIFIRLRIEPSGRPSRCDVMRSFGDATADQWTCALLMRGAVFRPALDARGMPVASWVGYKQVDISR
jgi:protein TonB